MTEGVVAVNDDLTDQVVAVIGLALALLALSGATAGAGVAYAAIVTRQVRAEQRGLHEQALGIEYQLRIEQRRADGFADDVELVLANQRRAREEAAYSEKCDAALFYARQLERDELQRRYKERNVRR